MVRPGFRRPSPNGLPSSYRARSLLGIPSVDPAQFPVGQRVDYDGSGMQMVQLAPEPEYRLGGCVGHDRHAHIRAGGETVVVFPDFLDGYRCREPWNIFVSPLFL